MATTTTVHAQLIRYATNGDQVIVNLKSAGSDISIDRTNSKLPTSVTTAQTLANALGNLAFKDSLSKGDVGLGSVDNTSDANKSVKYATSAGSASTATKLATARAINGVNFDGSAAINITANPTETEVAGKDLNVVTTPGMYYAGGSNTNTNKPSGVDAFGMIVFKTANGYTTQILVEGNGSASKTWIRQYNGSAWSAWAYYYNTSYKPSKSDVGLGSVDNTSDANKSVKYATSAGSAGSATKDSANQQINTTYIKGLSASGRTITITKGDGTTSTLTTQDTNTTYSVFAKATADAAGGTGLVPAPAKGQQGLYLRGDGSWATPTNTTYGVFKAATSSAAGGTGLVPQPAAGAQGKFLRGDGTWQTPTDTNTWRGVQDNLTSTATDQSLSANQGRVLKSLVDGKAASSHTHTASQITDNIPASKITGVLSLSNIPAGALERLVPVTDDTARLKLTTSQVQNGDVVKVNSTGKMYFVKDDTKLTSEDGYEVFAAGTAAAVAWANVTGKPSSMPASDVSSWAKASTKPTYTKSEVGLSNVDNTADANKSVKYATSAGSANAVAWANVSGKPAIVGKQTRTLTAAGPSGWKDATTDQGYIPDMSFIAYWNGAYSGSSSNLAYCNKGAFGSIVTKNSGDYATAGHTHNYAGSGSAGGSANSAVKLATARSIGLNGDASGSINFDGTGNVTIPVTIRKTCFIGSDAANTNGWYKVASQTMSGYGDTNATFIVTSTYAKWYMGVFALQIRSDNTSIQCPTAKWLVRTGFDAGAIRIVISGMTWTMYVNQTNDQYGRIMFEVISQSTINNKNAGITFFNSTTKESTTPTATVTSSDGGTVSYANSAGTATTASNVKDSNDGGATTFAYSKSGLDYANYTWLAAWNGKELRAVNKSQFATASHTHSYAGSGSAGGSANSAVKLDTATAGSTTQPVYFTGGKPTAIGYTIASNVPANAKFTDTNTTYTVGTTSYSGTTKLYTGTGSATDGTMTQSAITTALNGKAASSHSHSAATSSANGYMSSADKAKLDFGDIVYVSKTTPTKACIWVKLD